MALPGIPALPPLALTGGAGGSAGPATAEQYLGGMAPVFDASGWTVATSGSKATGAGKIPWLLIAGVALLGVLLWRNR